MSFWLVQIVSVVGVAAVILLTWAVGWSRPAEIRNLETAQARFKADFPTADVKGGTVAQDRRAALLNLSDGLGLVAVLGDELVTRKLAENQFLLARGKKGLMLELQDPTLARVRLAMEAAEAERFMSSGKSARELSSPASGGGEEKVPSSG